MKRLLLISNSTMAGEPYLQYPLPYIKTFLGEKPVNAVFIPFAAVTFSYDEYETMVQERFSSLGYSITSIHHFDNPQEAVAKAEAIVVGGGNTWHLVRELHDRNLMTPIREAVLNGTPYIGWSAGSNVACPTLRTTNDMPIIDPHGFDVLNLIPFQINPHYLDANPDGHAGETREQRIAEFIEINPDLFVLGLREGSMLQIEGNDIALKGLKPCRIFKKGQEAYDIPVGGDLSFLM